MPNNVSGHGITLDETGDYYFVPYDASNGSDITKTGISQDDFKKLISQIRAPKMALLLDTCESGSVASESFSSSIQRFGANTGVAIIAGATSKQTQLMGIKNMGFLPILCLMQWEMRRFIALMINYLLMRYRISNIYSLTCKREFWT